MELLSASARNKPLGTLRVQKAFIIIPNSFSGKFQSAIKSVKFFSLGGKLGDELPESHIARRLKNNQGSPARLLSCFRRGRAIILVTFPQGEAKRATAR